MPLPMIHFDVAARLYEGKELSPAFLLGSIAPDAIHMRKNTTRDDKKRTHFGMDKLETLDSLRELYRTYLAKQPDPEGQSFVRGYFVHVLTDYFWLNQIFRTFRDAARAEQLTPEAINAIYYGETERIDFNFYKHKPWKNEVWNKLISAGNHAFEPYLSGDEINFWRWRTVHWFDLLGKEPLVTPSRITETMVEAFIGEATSKIKRVLADWDATI